MCITMVDTTNLPHLRVIQVSAASSVMEWLQRCVVYQTVLGVVIVIVLAREEVFKGLSYRQVVLSWYLSSDSSFM